MRTIRTACLAALCAGALVAPAEAANRIEGTWAFKGGRVEITPAGGVGAYKGIITRRLKFAFCTHPLGERMWRIVDLANGTYRGSHINYHRTGCTRDPGARALWRVRKKRGRELLDFCANDPGSSPPTFTRACHVLTRVAPARDLAVICGSGRVRSSAAGQDVCIEGPAELREFGCVRTRGEVLHRFRVELKKKPRGRGLVNRGSRVRLVKFRLDGKPKGGDRRTPFLVTMKGAKLKPGGHTLVADVRLQVPRSKKKLRKKLTFKFDACG